MTDSRTPIKLAIYDMDKTITVKATWTGFVIGAARRQAPWRLALLPLVGLASGAYAAKLIDRARLKAVTQRLLLGRTMSADATAAAGYLALLAVLALTGAAMVEEAGSALMIFLAEADRLPATVLCLLEAQGSPRHAAQRLGIHENTVAKRVRAAEELLGHPVTERPAELFAALLIHRAIRSG